MVTPVTPAITPPTITPPAITRMSRARWWAYLIGSVLLAAFAIGRPLSRGWSEYARTHPVSPIAVAAGQEAHYADAQWRLVASSVETSSPQTSSEQTKSAGAVGVRRLPPGAALFRARFTLIPG